MQKSKLMSLMARMQRHAFLSGVVAARNIPGHGPIDEPALWTEYEPYPADAKIWEDHCESLVCNEDDLETHLREIAASDVAVARIAEQKRLDDGIALAEVEGIAKFERAGA